MSFLRMILAGLQLLAFRPVNAERFRVGFLTVALAVLATLAAGAGFETLSGLDWRNLSPTGTALQIGRWAVIAFGVGLLVALANRAAVGAAVAAVTAVTFWSVVVTWALLYAVRAIDPGQSGSSGLIWQAALVLVPVGASLVLLAIGTFRAIPLVVGRRALLLSFAVFGLLAAAQLLLPSTSILRRGYGNEYDRSWLVSMAWGYAVDQGWMAMPVRDDAEDDDLRAIDPEEVLGKQPALLDRQLAFVESERPKHRDLYLLGFAGYGWQAVFRREVAAVDELFAKRFDTHNRSLQLINSTDTVDELPLAGPHNLDVALQKIGDKMNKDEDVLFLFMTSHGGPGKFSVDMAEMPFHDITPRGLKDMLDGSGIKNRVIVLSACFSGSFIKQLAGDTTLIMTAARPDRTSFGCANDAEWTYFGDALFNHALRREKSFAAGFETARKLVAGWESVKGLRPSEPQISIGRNIEAVLAELTVGPPELVEVAERR
jgi:hypothetical protein